MLEVTSVLPVASTTLDTRREACPQFSMLPLDLLTVEKLADCLKAVVAEILAEPPPSV